MTSSGQDDGTDGFSKLFKRKCGCCEDKPDNKQELGRPTYEDKSFDMFSQEHQYVMSGGKRGEFIIINNKTFKVPGLGPRDGTDVDAGYLEADFRKLGFTVKRHNDLTAYGMRQAVSEAVKRIDEAKEDVDSFGLAVLSHGGKDDIVYGTDGELAIKNLIESIKKCPKLIGKPKIFIIQACRGECFDDGVVKFGNPSSEPDAKQPVRIPIEADCLYAYSTVQSYYSWRNSGDGSWFIQALHGMLQYCFRTTSINEIDFIRLLTRVSHQVAYNYRSSTHDEAKNGKKQVPSIVSMLTKDLILPIPR